MKVTAPWASAKGTSKTEESVGAHGVNRHLPWLQGYEKVQNAELAQIIKIHPAEKKSAQSKGQTILIM